MPPISEERLNEIIAEAVKAIRAEAEKTIGINIRFMMYSFF
jgi:hypothetical protein